MQRRVFAHSGCARRTAPAHLLLARSLRQAGARLKRGRSWDRGFAVAQHSAPLGRVFPSWRCSAQGAGVALLLSRRMLARRKNHRTPAGWWFAAMRGARHALASLPLSVRKSVYRNRIIKISNGRGARRIGRMKNERHQIGIVRQRDRRASKRHGHGRRDPTCKRSPFGLMACHLAWFGLDAGGFTDTLPSYRRTRQRHIFISRRELVPANAALTER